MSDPNPHETWIGFDLGGTKMLAAAFDSNFNVLARTRTKTRAYEGMEAGLQRIIDTIHKTLTEAGLTPQQIAGIGVGCPGPLDLDKGLIRHAPNLGWRNVPIRKLLEDRFQCPAVIANDVDAGVFGEYTRGAAVNARCVLGVFPGTGIGGGCVYEGHIIRGKNSSCLEIGHVQVMPGGPLCGCGRRGCLEALAGRQAIAAEAAKAAMRGLAPHLFQNVGTDPGNIRSGALSASIKAGDAVVEEIIRHAARQIGWTVGAAVSLLAPDVVVLGGGLVEAMPDLFVEEVKAGATERVMPTFENTFAVRAAKLADDATILGAAAWARHTATTRAVPAT